MDTFQISAYAKVNMTLEVLWTRPDGFHALRSIVMPIGLCDTLSFIPADAFTTDTGYSDDLILKAAHALARTQSPSIRLQPYAIHVEKRIPAGGGLGGGSADAAATLLALNYLWHLGRTPEELATLGVDVGSDVPALVLANHDHRPILMEGRGEIVTRLPAEEPQHLILLNPGVSSSTPSVYAAFDRLCDRPEVRAHANHLQMPAMALYPKIGEALEVLKKAGVQEVMMSGSGSTVFGRVASAEEGRRLVAQMRAQTACAQICYTTSISTGV